MTSTALEVLELEAYGYDMGNLPLEAYEDGEAGS